MKVYAFCYMDYDGFTLVTLHQTKLGAYRAMKACMYRDYENWRDEMREWHWTNRRGVKKFPMYGGQYFIQTRDLLP